MCWWPRTICENAGLKTVAGKKVLCLTWAAHRLIQATVQFWSNDDTNYKCLCTLSGLSFLMILPCVISWRIAEFIQTFFNSLNSSIYFTIVIVMQYKIMFLIPFLIRWDCRSDPPLQQTTVTQYQLYLLSKTFFSVTMVLLSDIERPTRIIFPV